MKNFFKKIKPYGFWVSFASALVMLLNSLGKAFGFEIDNKVVEDCVMSVASFLAVFGIVSMNGKDDKSSQDETNEDENQQQNSEETIEENDDSEKEE